MDPKPFSPTNDIELYLTAPRSNMSLDGRFDSVLLDSHVLVLVDRQMQPGIWDPEGQPLILLGEGTAMMPLFTSSPLIKHMVEAYPKYRFHQRVAFTWLLSGLAPDVDLCINPGLLSELDIPRARVALLKAAARGSGAL